MLINMELLSLDSNNTHDLFKYQLIFTNLGMYVSRISIFILVILLICFNQWLQKKKKQSKKNTHNITNNRLQKKKLFEYKMIILKIQKKIKLRLKMALTYILT